MRPAPPQARAATRYRKPRRVNVVSVALLIVIAAIGYTAVSLWPVYNLRAAAKAELEDALPRVYQLNLRPKSVAEPELAKLKRELHGRLVKAGVKDRKLQVIIQRDKKTVALEARFTTSATFAGWGKTMTFSLAPRARTDAARVEW